jgi:hypothetical protein
VRAASSILLIYGIDDLHPVFYGLSFRLPLALLKFNAVFHIDTFCSGCSLRGKCIYLEQDNRSFFSAQFICNFSNSGLINASVRKP